MTELFQSQKRFFASGATLPCEFRRGRLRQLKRLLVRNEPEILKALRADFTKPEMETFLTETAFVHNEIDHALGRLSRWMRPARARVPLILFPGSARVLPRPYGVCLIFSPWNYPLQLTLSPLVAALAAGNTAILKPSEKSPETSAALAKLVSDNFDPGYLAVAQGGPDTANALLQNPFDFIFYTGNGAVGKLVMKAAAEHLTPVALFLGGKCPAIVDRTADARVAARRIAWGKFMNAGQTCVSPDYVLAHRDIKPALLDAFKAAIRDFYGSDPSQSPHYARIINGTHVRRLAGLMKAGEIACGGRVDEARRYVEPTVIHQVGPKDPVMREEVFGPVLPVLEYGELNEALDVVNAMSEPLAVYVFTRDKRLARTIGERTRSGSVCVNDTVVQFVPAELPFGGKGGSGFGRYHGRAGFDLFSYKRGVFRMPFFPDIKLRYPPYPKLSGFVKKFLRMISG